MNKEGEGGKKELKEKEFEGRRKLYVWLVVGFCENRLVFLGYC